MDFSLETMETRRKQSEICKVLKGKQQQKQQKPPRFIYQAKLFPRSEGKDFLRQTKCQKVFQEENKIEQKQSDRSETWIYIYEKEEC